MRRKSREHRFSSMERRTTKMNLKLHFVFLGYKTMKRSQVLLLAYLQWNFVLYKRKKKNSDVVLPENGDTVTVEADPVDWNTIDLRGLAEYLQIRSFTEAYGTVWPVT